MIGARRTASPGTDCDGDRRVDERGSEQELLGRKKPVTPPQDSQAQVLQPEESEQPEERPITSFRDYAPTFQGKTGKAPVARPGRRMTNEAIRRTPTRRSRSCPACETGGKPLRAAGLRVRARTPNLKISPRGKCRKETYKSGARYNLRATGRAGQPHKLVTTQKKRISNVLRPPLKAPRPAH